MGLLYDRDAWLQALPEKTAEAVVSALESWVAEEPFDLRHRGWFQDGRSSAPVAWALREGKDDAQHVVLKFSDTPERIENLRRGWRESPREFRQTHLAETEPQTIRLTGTWRAAFMSIAGGHLRRVRPLNEQLHESAFPAHCATVVRSNIDEWNRGNAPREPGTVGEFIAGVVGRRRADAEAWAGSVGVAVDGSADPIQLPRWPEPLPNPFQLLSGAEAEEATVDMIVGRAHGDLSGRNILVPSDPEVDANAYVLIDYDRFAERAPLARDPMHLLVALALDDFDMLGPALRPALARVLVDPDARSVPGHLNHFRAISKAIHAAAMELAIRKSSGEPWRQHSLLALVGAGLVHLGRTLHTKDPETAKDWCLHLAAVATDTYLRAPRWAGGTATTGRGGAAAPGRGGAAPPLPVTAPDLVDRVPELGELRARLTNGPWGVVVLRGAHGVGKTALVTAALESLGSAPHAGGPPRIHTHDVTMGDRFDARTLIDYVADSSLASSENAAPHVRYAGSSLVRLEKVLHRVGDIPVVVTVDSAEKLIDPATRRLADPDLDEALELLATERGHRVTVLMVTREEPAPFAENGTWPVAERPIFLDKLEPAHFYTYLTKLDPKGRTDPGLLRDDAQRDALYHLLRGNPRLADLAYGVVVLVARFKLPALADHLLTRDRAEVPAHLVDLLVGGMHPAQQRVLQALAAFDTPVPPKAVHGLIANAFPNEGAAPDAIDQTLWFLSIEHIIRHAEPGQYFVPDVGKLILAPLEPAERARLFFHAATELTRHRNRAPHGVADLRIHLAELRALMNAGVRAAAYEMLDALDDVLREWNCEDLLLEHREQLRRDGLGNQRYEMYNENDLGGIYLARGEFPKADVAFGKALAIANAMGDDDSKIQIWPNLASLYWEINDIDRALCYYDAAHREGERRGYPRTVMLSLEGRADCHRRRGRYRWALIDAGQALSLAEEYLATSAGDGRPDTETARHRGASTGVAVALKLARWHAELGETAVAATFLSRAMALAHERSDEWLLASCVDGSADLAFNVGDLDAAQEQARSAVDQALRLHDPITLLQARTTLCLVDLKLRRFAAARREIERAHRYRRPDRSLIVLALLGLAARHADDHGGAEGWFRRLESEARKRVGRDNDDFGAHDLLGYAICGLRLNTKGSLDEAVAAVRAARGRSSSTPLLVSRLRFLLELLGERASRSDRLRPVIEALDSPSRVDD